MAARASARRTPRSRGCMYYSTGCSHAPHHVAKEWADKYKGKFDHGWDKLREQMFARQKKLGVIPKDAELTERPDAVPGLGLADRRRRRNSMPARWRSTPASRRTPTGTSGRLLDAIEDMGDLDNTLVIYIWGDNGASMEGTETGSFNEMTFLNALVLEAEQAAGADRAVRRDRRARRCPHGAALCGGVGPRRQHAVPVRQADGQPPGWHPQPHGHRLAEADQGRR